MNLVVKKDKQNNSISLYIEHSGGCSVIDGFCSLYKNQEITFVKELNENEMLHLISIIATHLYNPN